MHRFENFVVNFIAVKMIVVSLFLSIKVPLCYELMYCFFAKNVTLIDET